MATVQNAERFVLERTLGTGAMGTVHQAVDSVRGSTVAVKALHSIDPTSLYRFKSEFRALTKLAHPNLLQLYELVQTNDAYLLSMELVNGPDFLGFVRSLGKESVETPAAADTESVETRRSVPSSQRPRPQRTLRMVAGLDERKLRHALRQLAEGLRALHQSGYLHRDLKPANVLVFKETGRLVICDFGLVVESTVRSKHEPRSHESPPQTSGTTPTSAGQIAGTLGFMSPEQASGSELTQASDWYSVGVMLYLALTARLPFDPNLSWREAVHAKLTETPPHPGTIAAGIPGDLADLAMALLRVEPSTRAGYADVLMVLDGVVERPSSRSPLPELLVGRERELQQLHDAFARVAQGDTCAALVSGMSGMGKSAVVQRFLLECEQSGALVLRARCYECEDLPYKAFDPLMDALAEHLLTLDEQSLSALIGEDIKWLSQLFPALLRVKQIAQHGTEASAVDPFEKKRRAGAACRNLFHALAKRARVVLYVDDLQWGDLDSGPLFADLLRGPDAPPLLMVVSFRAEDERSPLIRALREDFLPSAKLDGLCELRLLALDREASTQLALALLGDEQKSAVANVVAEAGGSPFFVRELASFVRERGAEAGRGLSLSAVLTARVAALPESSRTLLEMVAVAGRPELQALLNEASCLGTQAFGAGQILKAHNLVNSTGSDAKARLEAYHDRIRETVYRALSEDRRTYLHRLMAVTLEQWAERNNQTRDAEALFEHWRKAGENKRAREYAVYAAEHAEAALAFMHAAKLYQQAAELHANDLPMQSELLGRTGNALRFAGRGADAAKMFFLAIQGADEARARVLRRDAITELLAAGHLERAYAELAKAEDLLGLPFPRSTGEAIAMLLWRKLRIKLDEKTLAKPRVEPSSSEVRNHFENLYRAASALSTVDFLRGGVYSAELTLRALAKGGPRQLATALSVEAVQLTSRPDPSESRRVMKRAVELAYESNDPYAIAVVVGTAGIRWLIEGYYQRGLTDIHESQRIHRETLNSTKPWDLVTMDYFELRCVGQMGQLHVLSARVPELLRDAEARGDMYTATMFRAGRMAWAFLALDRPEQVLANVETAERTWKQSRYALMHFYSLQARCDLALYQGQPERVWQQFVAERKEMKVLDKIRTTRADAQLIQARLALALARKTGQSQYKKQALSNIKALEREPTPWVPPMARLLRAALTAFDSRSRALRELSMLPLELMQLDMLLPAAAVRYRIGQLRGGHEGAAELQEARSAMQALGVLNPEAFIEVLAPGF